MKDVKNMPLKKVGFCLIVLYSLVLVSNCLADDKSELYSDLLTKAVLRAGEFRGGFNMYETSGRRGRPHEYQGSPKLRRFVEGLDAPNAVPFLIGVLRNGPSWTDEMLLKGYGGMMPHIARCYAALCLGASGDWRAFEPLIDMLENGEYLDHKFTFNVRELERQPYDIRRYAAIGLGFLNDPNGFEPLLRALEQGNLDTVHALAMTRDPRVIKPIIKAADDPNAVDSAWYMVHEALQYVAQVKFTLRRSGKDRKDRTMIVKEIPELGVLKPPPARGLWLYWLKHGPQYAKREFDKHYPGLRRAQKERPRSGGAHDYIKRKMLRGGIAVLPFVVEKVKEGDLTLIPTISELTNCELKGSATQKQCLKWWEKNHTKWLMPFAEPKPIEDSNKPTIK